MNRDICIHGHFYQPPRENPWLEAIELQDATYPYHDWNERITAECYATNATSRILDEQGRIARIINNYAKISFNFGPTLLAWMEREAPDVYAAVLEADKESQLNFSGHGSAIAQGYNHLIMPLASSRDKRTQVIWGIRDFEHHFGRKPEGMWLPETAVDLETLDILAEQGIQFTILAPHQAGRVRKTGSEHWEEVRHGAIDPKMPYRCHLPSGRAIALFFYDGSIAHDVAFGDLLKSGERFAQRLLDPFSGDEKTPQLVHIASDGETYGHHHRFGDMALSYALHHIESKKLARLSNYGEYLEKHPPIHEVEIHENTSWSCAHGVERWRSDCGCRIGEHPQWHQAWRAPLRAAMDWLRDTLLRVYDEKAHLLFKDPENARNDYIDVILNRSQESIDTFVHRHCHRTPPTVEKTVVLKLLELQRYAMLMYTSCGWFFDELSGIETVQIMRFAGRVLQLAREALDRDVEARFLELLGRAKSNIPELENGHTIYEKSVRPAMLDLERVCAHHSMSSLFQKYPDRTSVYCYTVEREDTKEIEAGKTKLIVGHSKVTSETTGESSTFCSAVLHMGDHNLTCGVREFRGVRLYKALMQELSDAFNQADYPKTLRLMDRHFGTSAYSLKSLFRDEQREILDRILKTTLGEAEGAYRQLYEYHAPLMRFLKDIGIPPPKALYSASEVVLNSSLRTAFGSEDSDPKLTKDILEEAQSEGIQLDAEGLEYTLRNSIERLAKSFRDTPTEMTILQKLEAFVTLLPSLPFRLNLWTVQNMFYNILQDTYPEMRAKSLQGDTVAQEWVPLFRELCKNLNIRVDE
jgi:alpha-amylase/alpha-mannosidase (GH57 family)